MNWAVNEGNFFTLCMFSVSSQAKLCLGKVSPSVISWGQRGLWLAEAILFLSLLQDQKISCFWSEVISLKNEKCSSGELDTNEVKELEIWKANAAVTLLKQRPEKIQALNGIRTHELCDTGAVLSQLSYQNHMRAVMCYWWTSIISLIKELGLYIFSSTLNSIALPSWIPSMVTFVYF